MNKHITIVSTNADNAGAPLHVETVVSALSTQFTFHCIFGQEGPVASRLKARGIKISFVDGLASSLSVWRDVRTLRQLADLLRRNPTNLVHAHSAKAGLLARLAARTVGVPCLYTVHGWGFGEGRPRLQSTLVKLVEWFLKNDQNSRFIYVSEADADVGRRILGIALTRGVTIQNGVKDFSEPDGLAKPEFSDIALMAARVSYQKDHYTLLSAFSSSTYFQLALAGAGTETEEFKNKVIQITGARVSHVRLLGVREDISDLMRGAGVYILSSRYEGLPLSILEAMSLGLPIIASNVGGVNECVEDGVNGYLIPAGDIKAMGDALCKLESGTRRLEFGAQSRRIYLEKFSVNRMLADIRKEYERSLGEYKSL